MPTNQTPNLKLSQWEPDDEVLRTDFNTDNAKIDAAVAKCFQPDNLPWVMGTYVGTAESSGGSQTIVLGFKPKFLIIVGYSGSFGVAASWNGKTNSVSAITSSSGTGLISSELTLTDNGFQVRRSTSYGISVNYKDWDYIYFALR